MTTLTKSIVIAVITTSCATPREVSSVRFANAPPVTVVDDKRNVAAPPQRLPPLNVVDFYDRAFADPITRALSLPTKHRARGVNSFDDVPDSTWFTNRIGVRDLTPAEVAMGPVADDGPEAHKPWTVQSTKEGGTEPGLLVTDARGVKYLIAFDDPRRPELETGTAVVVNRLLWSAGYNVPADQIAYVRREELVLAPDAEIKDHLGKAVGQLDQAELDRQLARAWHAPDGEIRVLASRWLPGQSLGGTPPSGVRTDDRNDVIPHEDRRDQRGQYPLFAWLGHVDLVQSNFLDMWVTDPGDPSRHYVVHYKVDFGKSLGTMAVTDRYIREGHAASFDWSDYAYSLVTFGLAPRPWGHHWAPPLVGVSPTFTAQGFDPGGWRPGLPYAPFDEADRFDMFWGAKVMARFTPQQIRAAVMAGRFSDPRAIDYITETLIARQIATVAYWFARVNPLDRFAINSDALCFTDLAIDDGFAVPAATRYELASFDAAGRPLGRIAATPVAGSPMCARGVPLSTARDGYTIVKITTRRFTYGGSTLVHLARAPSGAMRVVGVWRI